MGKCGRRGYTLVLELLGLNTWTRWVECVWHVCMLVVYLFVFMHRGVHYVVYDVDGMI